MTVLEALKETRDNLAKIPLRISDFNEIGVPIHTAVQNIGAIITALEAAEEAQKANTEKAGAEDEQQA